jgi:hypothetical protein
MTRCHSLLLLLHHQVWEVVGQLSGLAATVIVLRALEQHPSAPVFFSTLVWRLP